jgi:hypothetical protein
MADDGEKLTFWFQQVTPHGPRHKVEKGKEPFDVPAGFGRTRRPAPVRVCRRLKLFSPQTHADDRRQKMLGKK